MSLDASAVLAALQSVRDGSNDFVLCGFAGDDAPEGTLTVIGKGTGGAEALKRHLPDSDVAYGLIRQNFTMETAGVVQTDTVKHIFVLWRPSTIPLKRKMILGKYEGQIKHTFQSYHASMDINDEDEVSTEIIEALLAKITQTDTKVVTDRKSTSMYMGGNKLPWKKTSDSKVLKSDSRNEFKVAKGANLKFEDEGAIAEAIADVRDDASSTQWCLASYSARDTLRFAGKGDGDVDEMLATCSDGVASYGFFRVTEQYDRSTQTRFVFVIWSPENLKPMERALMSTHKGAITPIFRPYHQDFNVNTQEELTHDIVMEKISGLTGTRSHVTETRKKEKKKSIFGRTFLGGVKAETQKLEMVDEDDLRAAIADVRSDSSATNWVTAAFIGDRKHLQLKLTASGPNGLEEMVDSFDPEQVAFGLLRTEEVLDRSSVVKFYLAQWQGVRVGMTTAGAAGVLTGAVTAVLGQHHNSFEGGSVDEMVANAKKKVPSLR